MNRIIFILPFQNTVSPICVFLKMGIILVLLSENFKNNFMKTTLLKSIFVLLISALFMFAKCENRTLNEKTDQQTPSQLTEETPKIQVAILLDASNSMDGLINQAKARLWSIVNTLTTLKFNRETPTIEIALYMYGNDGLPASEGYIRQILPFTRDLDLISAKLFSITTNGGSEYCGTVIKHSLDHLDWDRSEKSMKLIYIAGNEPFTQGSINYRNVIGNAVEKGVFVNTIHCGTHEEGISGFWQDAAIRGKGKYFSINSNKEIRYIITPYDDMISQCNVRLNNTYIYYGTSGAAYYSNQSQQDQNAAQFSTANVVERTVSKSKKEVYDNSSWDVVDNVKKNSKFLEEVDKETLPKEYQNLTTDQLQKEIDKKILEREQIQKEIQELAIKRQAYIDQKMKEEKTEDDFGLAITTSIKEIAKIKGYE
jgi:hypothetical protein